MIVCNSYHCENKTHNDKRLVIQMRLMFKCEIVRKVLNKTKCFRLRRYDEV